MTLKNREAGIELLRVICMILIIFHHMGDWLTSHYAIEQLYPVVSSYKLIVDRFFNFHVDVFILISGYFGIKHMFRKCVNILVLMWFYLIVMAIVSLYGGGKVDVWSILNPVQESPWWFMCNYVYLILLSPYINMLTSRISTTKEWYKLLSICALFDIYFCWFLKEPMLNHYGHNIITFITMYIVGQWLASPYSDAIRTKMKIRGNYFGMFVVYLLFLVPFFSMFNYFARLHLTLPDYNSPLTIFGGICFFLMFKELKISYSGIITWLSESAVAVYLVHSHPVGSEIIIPWFWHGYKMFNDSLWQSILYVSLFVLSLYIILSAFDKIRIWTMRPVVSYINHKLDSLKSIK